MRMPSIDEMGLALLVVALLSLMGTFLLRKWNIKPLPPGPMALPLIGCIPQLAQSDHWRICQEWHKRFGPLMCFKLGTYTVISIGSQKLGKELLDKRGSIYSSRPRMTFLREFTTKNLQPALLPYGPQWRLLHRVQSVFLTQGAVKAYRPLQDLESLQLVHELLLGATVSPRFSRYGISLMFSLVFGKRMPEGDEKEVQSLARLIATKVNLFRWVPFLVDAFPVLQYIPERFAKWKKVAREVHATEIGLMSGAMNAALQTSHWNWTQEMNQIKEAEGLSWDQRCYVLSELYTAGQLTVTASLNVFATLCTQNPSAVKRAQDELDAVIGIERLPGFEDISRLPYIRAFMHEVLRWRPLIPTGIPHAVSKDDEYMGYRIPKDAFILPNHWCMEMDEEVHQDPANFRPERWLENPDLPLAAFGFGRRSCPGENMGRNSLFIAVARCLWGFQFVEQPEVSSLTIRGGNIVSLPLPAIVSLQVRSAAHKTVIEKSWMLAEKDEGKLLAQVKETFNRTTR